MDGEDRFKGIKPKEPVKPNLSHWFMHSTDYGTWSCINDSHTGKKKKKKKKKKKNSNYLNRKNLFKER